MIRIAILTSSRADFGIYLPLLKEIRSNSKFNLSIIAFGTHLSRFHGYTIDEIKDSGFQVDFKIDSLLLGDTPEAISSAIALTSIKFSSFWGEHAKDFDLVFCLGDRYEMFAAVYSGIPFGIKFAHIHGGETTLGAFDNVYRHAISLASYYHFTATDIYAKRVELIIGNKFNVYSVGSLSVENITQIDLFSIPEFYNMWKIDLSKPTILVTFHPETIGYLNVEKQIKFIIQTLQLLSMNYQILLTMPNSDTMGSFIRSQFKSNLCGLTNIFIYESLGLKSYFSALKHCSFVFGNSSSGIIEAATFGKYVINIGSRQEGRLRSKNVFDANFDSVGISRLIRKIEKLEFKYVGENLYQKKNTAKFILNIIQENE